MMSCQKLNDQHLKNNANNLLENKKKTFNKTYHHV